MHHIHTWNHYRTWPPPRLLNGVIWSAGTIAILASTPALGTTRHVPDDFPTIGRAVSQSANGDTVLVAPGTYGHGGALSLLGKSIVVMSEAGSDSTVLRTDGSNPGGLYLFQGEEPSTLIRGFRLECDPGQGSWAVRIQDSSPSLEDIVIQGIDGIGWGVAIDMERSNASFTNCVVINNTGTSSGTVRVDHGNPSFDGCTFEGNASLYGGLALDQSRATITNCSFIENTGFDKGSALYLDAGSSADIRNCVFEQNSGLREGGAIYSVGKSLVIEDCNFDFNHASERGGALYVEDFCSLAIRGSTFLSNIAGHEGGAIFASVHDSIFISNSTFLSCTAGRTGGAADLTGSTVRILDSVVVGNKGRTGGFDLSSTTAEISRTRIERNSGTLGAGGISFDTRVTGTISSCVISENVGGGVRIGNSTNTADIVGTWFHGNQAFTEGGGGLFSAGGNMRIAACLFTDNYTSISGGALKTNDSDVQMQNCTFYGNDADVEGGAFRFVRADVRGANIVIYSNTQDPIALAPSSSLQLSYSNVEGGWSGPGNISADPKFVSWNGIQAIPSPRSPCIDSGTGAADALDWSSLHPAYGRINTATPDMGAYGGFYGRTWLATPLSP